MHRLLTLTLAVLLAGFASAAPQPSVDPKDGELGERRHRHHQRKKPARSPGRKKLEMPVLFKEASPYRAGRMMELPSESGEFRRAIQRANRWFQEMEKLQRFDMEAFEQRIEMMRMEDDVERLADELREAKSDKERAKIEKNLEKKLSELFDRKEAAQRERIGRMEREIEELKAKLDRRHQNRAKIIRRRLEELRGDDELRF